MPRVFQLLSVAALVCGGVTTCVAADNRGAFTYTGALRAGRVGHTATLLADGRVLVTGGTTITGFTATAEIYHPDTGLFSQTGDLLAARSHSHTATLLANGQVLIVGNPVSPLFVPDCELFDPVTGRFSSTGGLNVPSWNQSATRLADGRVLVTGGDLGAETRAEIYDPVSQMWTRVSDTLYPHSHHDGLPLSDGRVLLAGGLATGLNAEVFDPVSLSFQPNGGFLEVRGNDSITLLANGLVLRAGGNYPSMYTAELFDAATGASTNLGLLGVPRLAHSGTLLTNGNVLLAGGVFPGGATIASAEIYEPAARTFAGAGSLRIPRQSHTATRLLDGRVLIVGGADANGVPVAPAELFDPSASNSLPFISVLDATVAEGNTLTNLLAFQVRLSKPFASNVAVNYATRAGTATVWGDYGHVMDRLTFPPGVTNLIVAVPVYPDTFFEPDETLFLELDPNSVTNAIVGRGQGAGTILNDEPQPFLSVSHPSAVEGNRGYTNLAFDIVLSTPSQETVWARFATADSTARAVEDYAATNGLLAFPLMTLTQRVLVPVKGDYTIETTETVLLQLSSVTNAAAGPPGIGSIVNDDGLPGVLHHYAIAPIPSPQYWERPTTISIEALDAFNQRVNVTGSLDLFVLATNPPSLFSDFDDGTLDGWTPLNLGSFPGPYQVVPFDVDGDSHDSPAFRIEVDNTARDGLGRDVELVVGSRYKFSYDIAQVNEQTGRQLGHVEVWLEINGTPYSLHVFAEGLVPPGAISRAHRTFDFMPPTNGLYRVELTFYRFFSDPGFVAYVDNFEILAHPTDVPTAYLSGGFGSRPLIWQMPFSNAVLMARDAEGRVAFSNPFDAIPSSDLLLYSQLAFGAFVGRDIEWRVEIRNQGPAVATGVVLTNYLPTGMTFVSAREQSGASYTNDDGVVRCALGTIPRGGVREVRFVARAPFEGSYTNRAIVGANEPDIYGGDTNVLSFDVYPPRVVIGDGRSFGSIYATENPAGTNIEFLVTLGAARTNTVTVDFYTAEYPSAVPGLDYVPTNGTLVFMPGVTQQFVRVIVLDDALDEHAEYVLLYLTNAVNASIDPQPGQGVILDNNDPPAALYLSDASVVEGDAGTTNMVFNIAVSPPSGKTIWFQCVSQSGTALAGSDFVSTNIDLVLPPGMTNATFSVLVRGNTVNEPNETFQARLTNQSNCTLGRPLATGTILNDDAVPGRLDHFLFSVIPSPQAAGRPVPITVRAVDAFDTPVLDFNGVITLTALARTNQVSASVTPATLSNFVAGVWTGTATLAASNPLVMLRVADAAEHTGQSNPFDVLNAIPLTIALPPGATEGDGLLAGAGRVTLGAPQLEDITVSLSAGAEISTPPSVVVPAGLINAVFDVTVLDDGDYDGSRSGSVTASAPFFATAGATMAVHDNENGVVTLFLPATAREGDAPVPFRVTIWPPTHPGLNFFFSNSAPGEVSVPGNVGFSAGATSLVTTVSVVDDNRIDGTQFATVTALIPNWTVIPATIAIADNESTNLALNFGWQGPYREGMGTITNFRVVRLSGVLPTNLVVNLTSSDESELLVPPAVTISAGQVTAGFNATLPDDPDFDGAQNVVITASAPGFGPATNNIPVGDNEVQRLVFSASPKSSTLGVLFTVQVMARDINDSPILGLRLPLTLTAVGDHGPVPLTYPNQPGRPETDSRLSVAANAVDTNVRLMAATSNGVSVFSEPFDVTPPAIQFPGVTAVDVACDPVARRLYAVVPTNAATHAGRLVRVAPDTGAVEASVPTGFNPYRVVVDDLGRHAYVTDSNGLIRRFRLDTLATDLEFQLDPGLSVEDFAVMPGHAEVLAVARRRACCSPRHAGVVLYADGIALPLRLTDSFGPNRIEFGSTSNRLYGLKTESNSFTFFRLDASAEGLTVLSMTNGFGGPAADFRFAGGRVYSTLGRVADAETGASVGLLPWTGPVAADSSIGRVFAMHSIGGTVTWRLEVLVESNLTNAGFVDVSSISAVTTLVRCGADTIAFVNTQGLGLIHTPLISDTDADSLRDEWERRHFGSLDSLAGLPGADPDGDGRTNLQEFQSGTDPTDAASVLRITAAGRGGSDNVIMFTTVIGKRYRLLRAATMPGVWQTVSDNIIGVGGLVSITDAGAAAQGQNFYRVLLLP